MLFDGVEKGGVFAYQQDVFYIYKKKGEGALMKNGE